MRAATDVAPAQAATVAPRASPRGHSGAGGRKARWPLAYPFPRGLPTPRRAVVHDGE